MKEQEQEERRERTRQVDVVTSLQGLLKRNEFVIAIIITPKCRGIGS
jgi:hypothetical protein